MLSLRSHGPANINTLQNQPPGCYCVFIHTTPCKISLLGVCYTFLHPMVKKLLIYIRHNCMYWKNRYSSCLWFTVHLTI